MGVTRLRLLRSPLACPSRFRPGKISDLLTIDAAQEIEAHSYSSNESCFTLLVNHRVPLTSSARMPQKFRQRGKKKKGSSSVTGANSLALATPKTDGPEHNDQDWTQSDYVPLEAGDQGDLEPEAEADHAESGVEHDQFKGSGHPDDIAPFGFVNPDLKSYLKDAQASLVQMVTPYQAQGADYADDDAEDQSEQAETLRLAMLREMDGQELACATDGEASLSLESVIHGLDARRLRILADRMSGRYVVFVARKDSMTNKLRLTISSSSHQFSCISKPPLRFTRIAEHFAKTARGLQEFCREREGSFGEQRYG